MKTPTLITALAALLAASVVPAADFYRCEVDGHVTFSQAPCGPGGVPLDYTTMSSGSGLRPGERALLDQVEAREAEDRDYKRFKYDRDIAHHVGHADQLRIRELEMDKRRLEKSVSSGTSRGKGFAVATQIDGINREIEQIRAPKW